MRLEVRNELCAGCRLCEVLCAMVTFGEVNPKLASLRIKGKFPAPGGYEVVLCDQCGRCAEVCPVDAIKKEGDHYRVDPDECTACLVCAEECPRKAMFVHPAKAAPFKCVLCGDCVRYCPREAIFDADGELVVRR